MKSKVIENALDYVVRAAKDLWDDNLTEEQQLKYSTIHLFEGIELLLKARLMLEHWSLILRDPDKYKKDSFEKGDFQSVNYEVARSRLDSICKVEIDERAHRAFDTLRLLRNKYVHFVCPEPRTFVMATQLKAWHYALHLLEQNLLPLSDEQERMLEKAKSEMRLSEEFLTTRFQEIQPELDKAREAGLKVATCPTCEKISLILGDGWPDCKVCARNDIYPERVADKYASMWDWSWKHPKHGPDDDVAWCEMCGEQACVPVGDDIREEVIRAVGLPTPQEPGEDLHEFGFYICFACGEPAWGGHLRGCGYCGASYFDSAEDADDRRLCPACGRF